MEVIIGTSDNYEEEVLKAERVIIDFNADWCGPCRMLGPILEEVAKNLKKTKVVSINVDDEEDLASEYNVFTIPCLVLLENGKEVKRNVGLISKEELGAGPAGMSAAIYTKRAKKNVLVIEALTYGGQIVNTLDIENYPAEAHISGFDFSTKLFNQAKELGAEFVFEKVFETPP